MRRLAEKLYCKVADQRNSMYDRGRLRSYPLGARTVSVGNITGGGTGKTPLVECVAKLLADSGEKVCVLTRGYGRQNENTRVLVSDGKIVLVDAAIGGDEPVALAQKLLEKAVVVAQADRVAAAKWAKENLEVTTFVLDDGFQHRRARRDLDIVCIDATDPFGERTMLRESVSGLGRADAMIITRADLVEDVGQLSARLRQHNDQAPIFTARTRIDSFRLVNVSDSTTGKPASSFAFCALGNPEAFFATLSRNEIVLAGRKSFRDHYRYTQRDLLDLEQFAKASGAEALLTTGKDAVKLSALKFEMPCFVIEVETVVDEADEFRRLVLTSS